MRRSLAITTALSMLFAASLAHASERNRRILHIGTTPQTSADEAALLVWNDTGERDKAKTVVSQIGPIERDTDVSDLVQERPIGISAYGKVAAAVAPGRYLVVAQCITSLRRAMMTTKFDAVAGKRYRVECQGRTAGSLSLVVTEL